MKYHGTITQKPQDSHHDASFHQPEKYKYVRYIKFRDTEESLGNLNKVTHDQNKEQNKTAGVETYKALQPLVILISSAWTPTKTLQLNIL